jgi:hypothetical protein
LQHFAKMSARSLSRFQNDSVVAPVELVFEFWTWGLCEIARKIERKRKRKNAEGEISVKTIAISRWEQRVSRWVLTLRIYVYNTECARIAISGMTFGGV